MAAPRVTGGDDLDDGLELDPSLLASDSEDGFDSDGDADFLSEDEEEAAAPAKGTKRKADDDEGDAAEADAGDAAAAKRRKRREKDKARRAAKRATAVEEVTEPTLLGREELAALLLASARATWPNGTAMELEDVAISDERILQPLDTLPDAEGDAFAPLVTRLNDILKDAPKKPAAGTPRALILCLSGIRCADVVRAVRHVKRPGGEVAKLFAKHFKLVDQVKYLNKTRVAIAVGTPGRIAKLLEDGALKISHQTVVLLDIGHRDSKTRTLLTLPEVRDEMWKSLLSGPARAALKPARFTAF